MVCIFKETVRDYKTSSYFRNRRILIIVTKLNVYFMLYWNNSWIIVSQIKRISTKIYFTFLKEVKNLAENNAVRILKGNLFSICL